MGVKEAAYAASETMSWTVSFSTVGFMRALPIPPEPCLKIDRAPDDGRN